MASIARFLTALAGMSGLALCAVTGAAAAATAPARPAPAAAAASLAVAGRPHQAAERSWQAAQASSQVTTWSRQATVTEAPATAPVVEGGITVYPDPSGYDPIGIVKGSDGALWYTNTELSSIGRITAAGKITHYTDPGLTRPFGIAAGSRRRAVVHQRQRPGSIGRITTSGVLTFYRAPRISEPDWIAAGPGDALWFTNESGGGFTNPLDRAALHDGDADDLHGAKHQRPHRHRCGTGRRHVVREQRIRRDQRRIDRADHDLGHRDRLHLPRQLRAEGHDGRTRSLDVVRQREHRLVGRPQLNRADHDGRCRDRLR